jgi:hypothetical protein
MRQMMWRATSAMPYQAASSEARMGSGASGIRPSCRNTWCFPPFSVPFNCPPPWCSAASWH